MATSLLRAMRAAIEEATLVRLVIAPDSGRATLRVEAPASGAPSGRRTWTFALGEVSRVAAWLREIRYSEPGGPAGLDSGLGEPEDVFPPEPVTSLRELNELLAAWSGHPVYGHMGEVGGTDEPDWLEWASLDLVLPGGSPPDHWVELWLADNPYVGPRMLDIRVEFGRLALLRDEEKQPPDHGPPGPRAPSYAALSPVARARGSGPADRTGGAALAAKPAGGGRGTRGQGSSRRAGQRRAPARIRRRRAVAVLAAASVLGTGAWLAAGMAGAPPHPSASPRAQAAGGAAGPPTAGLAAAESGLLPWRLAAPLSREVALPGPAGRLIVFGGLTSGGVSASGIYAIRTASGAARQIGALRSPLHDAAVAALGRRALVFGGGSSASVPTVEAFGLSGGTRAATAAGSMPAARSDAAAVTIGSTAYLVGGYDGARPDAQVLATTNGRTFSTVASLPVPVRYPAVAAIGGRIYVFGGQAVAGPHAGAPVDAIQAVDPARHTAALIGRLPEPLAGAAAATVGGELFLAGGESTARQRMVPGAGSTQLSPGETAAGAEPSSAGASTVSTIWAFDPATKRLLQAGRLQVPVSHAAVAVTGSTAWLVGGESKGSLVAAVQMLRPNRSFGTAGAAGAGSPYFGAKLLIADRGNDRLLLLSDAMRLVWKYPSAQAPRDPLRFYFPDDAFFVDHGAAILSNQEQNETIIKIAYPSGKILWSYGHPGRAGAAPGYLHEPDDAYLLKNGQITVADANNCRVLVINANGAVAHQIGSNGICQHRPPGALGSPNGDTPLSNGNLLISEINGSWVSEYTLAGKLVWTVRLPISYPSDPQQIGPDRYLIADYASPGQILEFNRQGRILYRYRVASGPGRLDHPSLTELLPSGVFMVNDDYNNRMAAIDPATGALVWQYGVTGRHGRGPGRLRTPDGFDLLLPNGATPTHPWTG